jgi:hypothetical protein
MAYADRVEYIDINGRVTESIITKIRMKMCEYVYLGFRVSICFEFKKN